ncbi:hypothetical protein B6N60_04440 [Richelia sinica FACHB-800]|uniref:Uncharacterized protein n=1 Tax=Richelia sinica FACHB-800 TaxID=1357546 RepID=A0A975TBK4_9NOST|nr:hypothetical protein B6N60_04440 [Richelia sinica FACHB-800]
MVTSLIAGLSILILTGVANTYLGYWLLTKSSQSRRKGTL